MMLFAPSKPRHSTVEQTWFQEIRREYRNRWIAGIPKATAM